MMIDPRFLIENYANSREEWLYNMPDYRGGGPAEVHTFDDKGEIVSAGTMSENDFTEALNEACKALGQRLCLYFYSQPLDGAFLQNFPDAANL